MLPKFSVKRAYTVLVGIVLIIVLGAVAATRMTTDLLPSMEFPYAIIITTYIGASPEAVEMTVTKPIEASMATLNNMKNISSSSSENYSMVMLEFTNDVNMDTATIDIRESLDQLQTYWPDEVGSPTIMKINPDMMPVMMAAVDVDGMNPVELTNYVNNTLSDELESIDGVASVTPMGAVSETVEITINEDKLQKVNDKVKKALDDKLSEAENELADGERELNKGEKELDKAKDKARDQLNDAANKINDIKLEMLKTELELKDALKQLEDAEKQLSDSKKELNAQKKELEDGIDKLETVYGQYKVLLEQKETLEKQLEMFPDSQELQMAYQQVLGALAAIDEGLAEMKDENGEPMTAEKLPAMIKSMKAGLKQLKEGLANIKKAEKDLKEKKGQIKDALKQIEEGKDPLNDQLKKLEKAKDEAEEKFIESTVKISDGKDAIDKAWDEFDKQKEDAYDKMNMKTILSEDMVNGMLTAENFSMPAGYVTEKDVDYLVRVGDKFRSLEELRDFVLLDLGMDGLDPIKLSDVADVKMVNDGEDSYVKINTNNGLIISVAKQTGYSTAEVSDRVKAKFETIRKKNSGVHFVELMDQGIYIDMIVKSVLQNLMVGALLAIAILLFFLKDIRPTGIIAVSIPVSVVFAIVLMYFSGVTLNVISLSGLALGVGMLVDNSIVVIENIYRLRGLGYSKKKAAIEGAKQVTGAIVASTATTVSVFAPIIFTSGLTKMLFVDMALTIGYSLLASLIIAITFVPMMASKVLNQETQKRSRILDWVIKVYEKMLVVALRFKPLVFLLVIGALVGSTFLAVSRGTTMLPEMDSTQLSMSMKMPEGTTDIKETAAMSDEIIKRVLEIEDVDTIGGMAGYDSMSILGLGGGGNGPVDSVEYYLLCKEDKKHSNEEIARMITDKTKDLDCEVSVNASSMDMSALGASGVVVRVKGKELDKLGEVADMMAKQLETVKGLKEVFNGQDDLTSEIRFHVNKDKAAKYGLTVAQVFQAVNAKLSAAKSVTTLTTDSKDYAVYVKMQEKEEITIDTLKKMTMEGTVDNEKKDVNITEFVEFEDAAGLSSIKRNAQSRYISVTAQIEDGYNAGLLAADVEKAIAKVDLPDGYSVEFEGENETTMEAMKQVGLMMLLAIVFMYLIMVMQFQSLKSPFIIMFTLPLAFTGGFLALFIANMEVSVIAMIGMVMLAGIIVNNGIVLVDAINQLREQGMLKKDAILEAARNRLRPIVMTALTTILGLSTMAAGMGMGADMAQPMAVVVIGGLIYGTLLTLFVVPCIYDAFHRKELVLDEEDTAPAAEPAAESE